MTHRRGLLVALALSLAACTTDDAGPVAPSNLSVSPLGAGGHVTWKDNSNDESEFILMRQQMGTDTAMKELARVPFNGTAYHDEPITSGVTYMYMVVATNESGESESDHATFVAP